MAVEKSLMKSLAWEFLGTFVLVFSIAYVGFNFLITGTILAALTYVGHHISGAVYNPAVALAMLLNGSLGAGRKDFKTFGFYVLAQMLGGLLGAFLGYMPRASGIACPISHDYFHEGQLLVHEFLWSMAICYVVLTTMHTEATKGKHFFGYCVGYTYVAGALPGQLSASFNPAVAVNLLIASAIQKPDNDNCADDYMKYIWIYAAFPFAGALAGWALHRITDQSDGKLGKFAPYMQELIGSFFLALVVAMGALHGSSPLAVGAILSVMVFCGAHVSGGQYNPAVSLGLFIRGALPLVKMFIFWGVQVGGALLGAFVAYLLTRYASSKGSDAIDSGTTPPIPVATNREANGSADIGGTLLGEFVATFFIVLTQLQVMTTEKLAENSYFGMAVGWAVIAATFSTGVVTGGAFNPALWTGTNLMYTFHENADPLADFWVYWVAELLGGVLAALFFNFVNDPSERKPIGGAKE